MEKKQKLHEAWRILPLLSPIAILSMFLFMCLAARYAGHWPTFNRPDPSDVSGPLSTVVLFIQFIVLLVPLYVCIFIVTQLDRGVVWKDYGNRILFTFSGWGTWLLFMVFAPGVPLVWMLD